jgi:hypothetical protein
VIIDQNNWKNEFSLIAARLRQSMSMLTPGSPVLALSDEEGVFSVAFEDSLTEFPAQTSGALTVGRAHQNDIVIHSHMSVSRCHCILFLVPESRQVILVDIGSASGIVTLRRSSQNPCGSSLPNQRSILVFNWGEGMVQKRSFVQIRRYQI